MVGIVVTISPNLSLYKIVVLPAASKPTINILISFLPKRPLNKFAKAFPMFALYISFTTCKTLYFIYKYKKGFLFYIWNS
uniref:Uncharacterized protein n=1 Tax=Haematobia irritans TaxID=7368 RepID=A0A1L8E686_HAEIR